MEGILRLLDDAKEMQWSEGVSLRSIRRGRGRGRGVRSFPCCWIGLLIGSVDAAVDFAAMALSGLVNPQTEREGGG